MATMSTINPTTNTTSNDDYLVRQGGIDYKQNREILAAGIGNARWINTANYLAGTRVVASNGKQYVAAVNTGPTYANTLDPTIAPNETVWKEDLQDIPISEVLPLNNDWNGYLDPAHTVPIEKSDTSAGTRSFVADTEIAPNLYVSANTDVTFSTTGISWLAGNSLYKLYDYTTEQLALIDINKVPVYLVGQDGSEHFVNNSTAGVTVSKVVGQLKVEIGNAIFAELGITTLWEFFVTDSVGRVVKLSVDGLLAQFINREGDPRKFVDVTLSRSRGVSYLNDTPFPKYINIDYFMGGSQTIPYYLDSYEFNIRSPASVAMAANLNVKVMPGESFTLSTVGTMTIYKWSERTI